jgi:hypothetical protein
VRGTERLANPKLTKRRYHETMPSSARSVLILALVAILAACVGAPKQPVAQQKVSTFNSADSRVCLSRLQAASVQFSALPNQSEGKGCRTIDTIKLLNFGTEATNLGAMTCPLAANFAAWAQHAAKPAARLYLGSELVRIETMGTYNCRNIAGGRSGRLSQHAFGNAIDVSAFILRDGRRISVLDGWNGPPAERNFLIRLHASACKRFGTVLGPNYNAAHANHLHFDMAQSMKDRSTFCR